MNQHKYYDDEDGKSYEMNESIIKTDQRRKIKTKREEENSKKKKK